MKLNTILPWVLRLIAAVIMLQTLFFKFSGAEESVYIFSTLGIEPWGRIGTGIGELIASVLLLIPATTLFGAFIALGLMAGAIASHVFILGIQVQGDHGQLFIYACLVMICSVILIWQDKEKLITLLKTVSR